jgi:hypothetical protein
MHIDKHDIPMKMNSGGAVARHLPDFGTAAGTLAAEYFTLAAGVDIKPLLTGLDDDLCFAAHWGYVIKGRVVVTYDDGSEETDVAGELFHWPAGHSVRVVADAEIVLFSPAAEHLAVMNHMLGVLATAPA